MIAIYFNYRKPFRLNGVKSFVFANKREAVLDLIGLFTAALFS